ncbi:stage III sporulation protein AD [Sulfoacidibacillus thermotolerans]|uniref:Stage III sporulation protein AD n=1 Tax=Sulfoacidibacillus thermotolerans TaxID=1765684 RepID=A0A2U3DBZ1_SULT2|nr:stage III sporulation protein AD [Sulfoacidibacillus thermotolerans]PWI58793.1 stage III sporulation protein AD [Sulfoacidibacillus thermotolerans]
MSILQIVLFGLVGALLITSIREMAPQIAFWITLIVSVFLFLIALQKLTGLLAPIEKLAELANVNVLFFATIVKIIGIAYIAEFGAEIARDAGVSAIAGKIELVGKLAILVLAVPIVTAVVQTVTHLLP